MRALVRGVGVGFRARAEAQARQGLRWVWALPGTPHEIAMGVAVGMFVAMTPTPGMQMVLAAALAGAIGCSARAAMVMTFVSNPLTGPALSAAAYLLGQPFFPDSPALNWAEFSAAFSEAAASWTGVVLLGEKLLLPFVLGSILLGLILAPPAYLAARVMCRPTPTPATA